jgi:hypothetical protein
MRKTALAFPTRLEARVPDGEGGEEKPDRHPGLDPGPLAASARPAADVSSCTLERRRD